MKVKDVLELIVNITQNATKCEENKERLNDHPKFEPYALFTRMDREDKGYLTKVDFINFLVNNKISIPLNRNTVDLFIEYYDRDFDGRLSFSEFLNFILNKEHNLIRSIATQRETYKLSNDEFLENDLEEFTAQLIMSEFFLFEYANVKKMEIFGRSSAIVLELLKLFQEIDGNKDGFLSIEDLNEFLGRKRVKICPEELMSFISLFDEDLDGELNWNEFLFMILPSPSNYKYDLGELKKLEQQYTSYYFGNKKGNTMEEGHEYDKGGRMEERGTAPCERHGVQRYEGYKMGYAMEQEQLKKKQQNDSLNKNSNTIVNNRGNTIDMNQVNDYDNNNHRKTIEYNDNQQQYSYQEQQQQQPKQYLQQKEQSRLNQSQSPLHNSGNINSAFSNLANLLLEIIDFENQINSIKLKISKDPNFSIESLFSFFDKYNNKYISLMDFQETLELFDISNKNSILVFGKYDKSNTGRLTFNNFANMFEGQATHSSTPKHQQQVQKDLDIDIITKTHIVQLLNTLINYETFLATLPKWYEGNKGDIFYCFDQLDVNSRGAINEEEFNCLFMEKIQVEDLLLLMEKIDADKDGNITLEDLTSLFK